MRAALVTMIVAACCGAPAPAAAAEWTEPGPLSGGGEPVGNVYEVVYDATGRGTAVWLQGGLGTGLPDVSRVMTADRPAGEGWQDIQRLSLDTRPSGTTSPADPGRVADGAVRVAVNAHGDTLVAWVERDHALPGANYRVRARLRPAGGAWGPTRDVSTLLQNVVNLEALALTDDGEALILWTVTSGSGLLQVAHLPAGAADWEAPEDVSVPGQSATSGKMAIGANGDALVAWTHGTGSSAVVRTRDRAADGTWSPPADVPSPGTGATSPKIAVDAGGNATVLFTDSNGTNRVVRSSRRPAGATSWPAAVQVSASGGSAEHTALVVEPGGDALAAWSRDDGTDAIAQAARRPAAGAWQTPRDLSAAGHDTRNLAIGLDGEGTATVAWVAYDGADPGFAGELQAARRGPAPDRTWSTTEDLGEVWEFAIPAVAVAPGGNATVAAKTLDGTLLSAVDFDAATPSLSALSVPPVAAVGEPLAFAVQATGATEVTWDFGDGATATGTSATHAYAAAGTYTVTARASDGFGAPAIATATVDVRKPVGDPGPRDPGTGTGSGGGGGTPAPGGPTAPPRSVPAPATLAVTLRAPAQRLATVVRRRVLTATCTLPVAGRCTVRATVTAPTARALGLKLGRGARTATLATGRATVAAGRRTTVRLRLPRAVVRRMARRRSVPLTLTVDGVARNGQQRGSATRRLTLR